MNIHVPFDVFEIPGHEAIARLEHHRSAYPTTGQYPFLIGDADELERLQESMEIDDIPPNEIISQALNIEVEAWLASKRKEAAEDEFDVSEIVGEWPAAPPESGTISIHRDVLTGKIKPKVFLGLARVESAWYLPAYTRYGNWNDCPAPDVHCALMKFWNERYAAEIVTMSSDVVECLVARPPTSRNSADELAWQQYWYCYDVVEQGVQSIANLAATLLNSDYWYFWWD